MGDQEANDQSSQGANDSNRKISVKVARKMLGMIGRNYSDDDIRQVLHILYGLAEEAYDIYGEDDDSMPE